MNTSEILLSAYEKVGELQIKAIRENAEKERKISNAPEYKQFVGFAIPEKKAIKQEYAKHDQIKQASKALKSANDALKDAKKKNAPFAFACELEIRAIGKAIRALIEKPAEKQTITINGQKAEISTLKEALALYVPLIERMTQKVVMQVKQ